MKMPSLAGLMREPLMLFLVVGGLTFLLYNQSIGGAPEIHISVAVQRALINEREAVIGRQLSGREIEALVASYLNEEILFREALARGIHEGDQRTRHRLVDTMRFLLTSEPEAPDESVLRAYFEANPELYMSGAAVSFEHVFFEDSPADWAPVRDALGAGTPPADLGQSFWLGRRLDMYDRSILNDLLGVAFTTELFKATLGEWVGPIISNRGAHLVRIVERHEPAPLAYDLVNNQVRRDWLDAARNQQIAAEIALIREKYNIQIDVRGDEVPERPDGNGN